MEQTPCNAVIPLVLRTDENNFRPLVLPVPRYKFLTQTNIEEVVETDKIENKELMEEDVVKFLSEDKDNIILVFGHKIYTAYRSVIKNNIKKPENIFVDDSGKIYYQIIGRHLIDENEIKVLSSKMLSIFNISTLKNVLKLKNKASPMLHSRGVYSVDAYTIDEYRGILGE